MAYKDYTDASTSLESWISEISPKYFDFDTSELHRSGVFGYVNEVMATVENDSTRSVATARREFYPTTAKYIQSFYKMGALHQISYPLATPAVATAALVLKEDEILQYATESNGVYRFVLDNTMVIMANNIEFRLDYPVIIIAKKRKSGSFALSAGGYSNDSKAIKYNYTVRYDTSYRNSLNTNSVKYIKNYTLVQGGETLLLIKVGLHQVNVERQSFSINSSPTITNTTIDVPFTGQLCNFEAYYTEANSDKMYQLTKLPKNANPINGKFCMHSLLDNHTLRIEFPANAYFTPRFNSTIDIDIYTTDGAAGTFPVCNVDLACAPQSENYPYNNNVTVLGQILGASYGGADFPELDDFANDVIAAYATNKTFTTEQDLQIYFDSKIRDKRNKVLFFKRRDDVFERLYGAFMLIKDQASNVIPTNTLTLEFDAAKLTPTSAHNKFIIPPGKVWKYQDKATRLSSEYNGMLTDMSLNADVDDSVTDFCYTNPFLIHVSTNANAVGYYLNTVNDTIPMDTLNVNDSSYLQFNINSMTVVRNAVSGENFYKFTIYIQPSVSEPDLSTLLITTAEQLETSGDENWPSEIRAQYAGIIEGYEYINNSVYMIVRYEPDIEGVTRSMLTEYMRESSFLTDEDDLCITIRVSSSLDVSDTESGQRIFGTQPWYTSSLRPGDRFTAGSIIAYRKLQDTGIMRVIGELSGDTEGNYIPFLIEDYDASGDVYTLSAYIATNDNINDNGRLEITHGFYNKDGSRNSYVSIDPSSCSITISTFLQYDDSNTDHSKSDVVYVRDHTFTNSYYALDKKFDLMTTYKFIRSTLSFNQYAAGENGETSYYIRLNEVPLVRANWMKNDGNVNDLISMLNSNYDFMLSTYDLLENNFSIDLKFFNTYGKSRFYRIGIENTMTTLDKVNIIPKFGLKVNALTSYEEFRSRFINYVRDYIESFNEVNNTGKSLYLMDLVTAIKNNFEEIERLEYYGIDNYSSANAQNIESLSKDEITSLGYNKYVPEFINVYCDFVDCELVPQIEITNLE